MDLFTSTSLLDLSIEPTEFDHDSFRCDVSFSTPQGIGESSTRVNGLWILNSKFDSFVSDVRRLASSDRVHAELTDLSEWFSLWLGISEGQYLLKVAFESQNDMYASTQLTTQVRLGRETIEMLHTVLTGFPRPWLDGGG